MIEALFAMLIGIITFIVMAAIVVGFIFLPLIFKGGWIIYVLYAVLIVVGIAQSHDKQKGDR